MGGPAWKKDHNPEARPLGCNGKWGTSGAGKHYRNKTPVCAKCRKSSNHYQREHHRKAIKPRVLKPCGTYAAYERHRRKKEPIDFACRLASSQKQAETRARQRARKQG